jgi:hypothetical protein
LSYLLLLVCSARKAPVSIGYDIAGVAFHVWVHGIGDNNQSLYDCQLGGSKRILFNFSFSLLDLLKTLVPKKQLVTECLYGHKLQHTAALHTYCGIPLLCHPVDLKSVCLAGKRAPCFISIPDSVIALHNTLS